MLVKFDDWWWNGDIEDENAKWWHWGWKSEIGILSAPPGGYGLFAEPDTQLGRGGSEWNVRENFNTTFPPTNRNLYCWNVCNQFCLFTVNFIVAKLVLEITSWHMQFYPQSFSDQMLKDCGRLQRNWGLAAKNDFFKLAGMPPSPLLQYIMSRKLKSICYQIWQSFYWGLPRFLVAKVWKLCLCKFVSRFSGVHTTNEIDSPPLG